MTLAANPRRPVETRHGALMTVSPSGEILHANGTAHRLLGYTDGSLIGLSLAWLAPPSRHEVLEKLGIALERATPLCVESVFMREDGALLPVDLTLRAQSSPGGRVLVLTLEVEEDDARPPLRAPSSPAPRVSGWAPKPPPRDEVREQLRACIQLLAWLEAHVNTAAPEEVARERARVRVVLQEAMSLLEGCNAELSRSEILPKAEAFAFPKKAAFRRV